MVAKIDARGSNAMKWFKHMTNSGDDEKLSQLLGAHGLEGYGVWWLILEVIAKQMGKDDDKCSVTYPLSYWVRLTFAYHHSKLKKILQSMVDLGLISVESRSNLVLISDLSLKDVVTIYVPNLLKYRDEYSKKSGQNPKNVIPKNKKQIQIENKEEKKETPPLKMTLLQIRTAWREQLGQELGGGVNQELSLITQNYTPEAIEFAMLSTSTRQPRPLNPFIYFKKVLEGGNVGSDTGESYDPNKTYEPGSFFYDLQNQTKGDDK